ncbi:MAG TPA: hypothetical protein VKZ53_29205 [Candidatus Angelobacter sp.]|nr:hypothetical protein [Candidatus Angelobacter sp.]
MIKKSFSSFALVLLVAMIVDVVIPKVMAQDAAAKQKTEKSAPDSSATQVNDTALPAQQKNRPKVIKTFYLPNLASASELQDIVNLMRGVLDIQRVQLVLVHQSIVVQGTEEQVEQATRLLNELDISNKKEAGQYRLEFNINELDEGRKLNSKGYSLLLNPHEVGKLRIGTRIPVQTGENTISYLDVGKNIDCMVKSEAEHSVDLSLTLEISDIASGSHGETALGHNPVVQQMKIETRNTLELGKTIVLSNFYDPSSKHTIQIDAVVTRVRRQA